MDHPRTRGEKSGMSRLLRYGKGSPPPARGKGNLSDSSCCMAGITPARAGKSFSQIYSVWRNGDHPRTRGEKNSIVTPLSLCQGSPPHTRGKATLRKSLRARRGITPAHAGKSLYTANSLHHDEDHPRTRGEKFPCNIRGYVKDGSPPHTRGKVTPSVLTIIDIGITPAHAGKRRRI